MALADYQSLTKNLVRDDSDQITDEDRDQAIALAAIRYSTDRPRTAIAGVYSTGGIFLDLPARWEADFSRLTAVAIPDGDDATPVGAALEPFLSEGGATEMRIRLNATLTAGETAHVHFTIAHVLDLADDTIPAKDREAVASLAASLLLEQLASLYSGHRQPNMQADTVDWQSKGRDYAARARQMRNSYLSRLGIDPKRTPPAGVVVDLDQSDSRGRDRLIHSRRRR